MDENKIEAMEFPELESIVREFAKNIQESIDSATYEAFDKYCGYSMQEVDTKIIDGTINGVQYTDPSYNNEIILWMENDRPLFQLNIAWIPKNESEEANNDAIVNAEFLQITSKPIKTKED